ncbi:hypothetical protein PYCC9005_004764 [Savitreella phatthalungensis]
MDSSGTTPSFDALFDGSGLTPYGARPGDSNPFDNQYGMAMDVRGGLGFHNQHLYNANSNSNSSSTFQPGGPGPPSRESSSKSSNEGSSTPPSALDIAAAVDNPTGVNKPVSARRLSQQELIERKRMNAAAQQLAASRNGLRMQDNPSFDPSAISGQHAIGTGGVELLLPGVNVGGSSTFVQPGVPHLHRESSSNTSSGSSHTAKRVAKIARRSGGGAAGKAAGPAASSSLSPVSSVAPGKVLRRRSSNSAGSTGTGSGGDETKRATFLERNRIAASKCRHKKKEWTNNLEAAARQASQQSRELQAIVAELQHELMHYQNELLMHQNCEDCEIQSYLQQLAARAAAANGSYAQQHPHLHRNSSSSMSVQQQFAMMNSGGSPNPNHAHHVHSAQNSYNSFNPNDPNGTGLAQAPSGGSVGGWYQ